VREVFLDEWRFSERTAFGASRRPDVTALWRCDLAGSQPALERRLIAFPKAQDEAL
jgi:hypothetical protein